jgi:2-desacetyl-2-hydroxyethyl bacteriochlorophyllide A dehydrogenase
MKALVYSAVKEMTVCDVPEPRPRAEQAVLKVIGTGICGSDMSGFLGHSARRQPPLILGHEVLGTVVCAPPGDWPFREGDRVVANPIQACGACAMCRSGQGNLCPDWKLLGMDREEGAFAEYVAVKADNLFPMRSDVTDQQAVMVEPLANGIHLFNLINRHKFGSLAILGAGTQGILMLALARLHGYRDIIVVDTSPERLAIAERFGAEHRLNPLESDSTSDILKLTGGGVDICIDAVGATATRVAAIDITRKGGEVMLLGLHDAVSALDINLIVRKEIRFQGSFAFTSEDFQTSKRLIESGDISIVDWTETWPLESGQAAFDQLTSAPGSVLKILLKP